MRINLSKNDRQPKFIRRNRINVEAEKQKETMIDVRVRLCAETVKKLDDMKSYGDRASCIDRAINVLYQKHLEAEVAVSNWTNGQDLEGDLIR